MPAIIKDIVEDITGIVKNLGSMHHCILSPNY